MRRSEVVLFSAMTALSGLAAAAGEPVGFIGLLFFGGGGIVYWYLRREPRPPAGWPYHGRLPGAEWYTGDHPVGVVFPGDRKTMVAAAIGSAIFVLTGVAFIVGALSTRSGGRVTLLVGIVTVAVFGAFLLLAGLGAVRAGGIALLREGIYCRLPLGTAWLPWDSLLHVSVVGHYGNSLVRLRARSPEEVTLTGLNRLLHGRQRRRYKMDIGYTVRGGGRHADDIRDAIRFYWGDGPARQRLNVRSEADRWAW